ncbi:kinase-like domain-containing protein [Phaeosphaeria sp. MPI-PUGE-AT-0046c]|nr:kinase-like domain-containing protein [Phaeosphaeria sp. MPI-PUGE-AT-0046c]
MCCNFVRRDHHYSTSSLISNGYEVSTCPWRRCPHTLGIYIDDSLTRRTFGNKVFKYLRAAEICDLASDHNIAFAVNSDTSIAQVDRNDMISKIQNTGRKVFVISMHGNIRMDDLRRMLAKDLSDPSLPLTDADFHAYRTSHEFNRFQAHQQIIPPVLRESKFLTYGVNQCVPFQRETLPIVAAFDRCVYRACIDTDYYDIAALESLSGNPRLSQAVAIVEIRISSPTQQARARSQIEFAKFLATHASHEHITKPYGTFALRSVYPGETTHYLVTELPRKNLSVFFQSTDPQSTDSWLHRQLHGLTAALALIHMPTNGRFGIHHDIRPTKIAVCWNGEFTFKLAPSPQSRVVAQDGQALSGNSATVSPYHPPESTSGLSLSRRHDVWSLGCLLLETIVWYTKGKEAYTHFLETASGKDRPQHWFIVESGQLVLQAAVKKQLATLQACGNGKWAYMVGIIRRMLATDPSSRITASELVIALRDSTRPS